MAEPRLQEPVRLALQQGPHPPILGVKMEKYADV